jgi:hypothetical protein
MNLTIVNSSSSNASSLDAYAVNAGFSNANVSNATFFVKYASNVSLLNAATVAVDVYVAAILVTAAVVSDATVAILHVASTKSLDDALILTTIVD